MQSRVLMGVSVLVLIAAFGTEASAQGGGAAQLEEIVVTAQRRSEDVQRAALAVTAVSGEVLQARGVVSAADISSLTAGLAVTPSTGPYTVFTVRSVSNLSGNAFADPAVAVNIAGVYLATPTTVQGLFYDLERVEILKGPQGALYGRNATAGAINLAPKRPSFEFGGDIGVDIGNFDKLNVNGAVNIPLSDHWAVRAAFQSVRHDGYFSDGASDEDVQAGRVSLRFDPSEALTATLFADWTHQGGKGPGASVRRNCGGSACFPLGPWTGVQDSAALYIAGRIAPPTRNTYNDSDFYGLAANIDWRIFGGALTVIPAYRSSDVNYASTVTGWLLKERQRPRQRSIELRFASGGEGALKYVLGAYYLSTEMKARANSESPAAGSYSDQHTSTEGWTAAGFGQLTWSLTDALRLTGGARYTFEEKSTDSRRYNIRAIGPDPVIPAVPVGPPVLTNVQTRDWDKVNWKAGVEWDPAPRSLLYANVSTGFKAGGFFYGVPGADTYQPEELTAYVLGSKNRFFDNRLQLNGEAYYYDYKNQQLSFVKLVGATAVLVTENVGKITSKGVELEADYLPFENTRLGLQLNWLDSTYDEFTYRSPSAPLAGSKCAVTPVAGQFSVDCSGLTPIRAPEWTAVFRAQQTFPLSNEGRLVAEIAVRYESAFESDVSYIPETKTEATTRTDLALTYRAPQERWSVRAYIDNVTDEVTMTSITPSNAYAMLRHSATALQPPRTYGVRVAASF